MAVDPAQAKIGFDLFMKLFGWATVRFKGRRLQKVVSEAYQELLKGDKADLMKVESALRQLRQCQITAPEIERLNHIHRGICGKGMKRVSVKFAAKKKAASKTVAMRKGTVRKPTTKRK